MTSSGDSRRQVKVWSVETFFWLHASGNFVIAFTDLTRKHLPPGQTAKIKESYSTDYIWPMVDAPFSFCSLQALFLTMMHLLMMLFSFCYPMFLAIAISESSEDSGSKTRWKKTKGEDFMKLPQNVTRRNKKCPYHTHELKRAYGIITKQWASCQHTSLLIYTTTANTLWLENLWLNLTYNYVNKDLNEIKI